MIDVQELRIGNLLLFKGEPKSIMDIQLNEDMRGLDPLLHKYCIRIQDEIMTTSVWLSNFKPMPLTEDILLKCGFGKTLSEGVYSVMDEDIYLKLNESEWEYQICTSSNNGDFLILAHVQFIHQVQNIFYCLNGEELKITL